MKRRLAILAIFCICILAGLAAREARAADVLDRFKALVGEWQGPYEWSGARNEKGVYRAQYYLTGLGSTVVENLITTGGETAMTSVYHKDGGDLRMTHYCATRVQSRMKATPAEDQQGAVRFSFVDATNLRSPGAPHVHGFEIHFVDANHVTLYFTFTANGKVSTEKIELTRVAGAK